MSKGLIKEVEPLSIEGEQNKPLQNVPLASLTMVREALRTV